MKSVRKDKSRSEEPDDQLEGGHCASDEKLCIALTHQVSNPLYMPLCGNLAQYIKKVNSSNYQKEELGLIF